MYQFTRYRTWSEHVQQRLRSAFSEHLKVAIDWHTAVLDRAMQLLVQQDSANNWVPAAAGAARLDSARGLMLECRKQADHALTVVAQSKVCVHMFMEGAAGVLQVLHALFVLLRAAAVAQLQRPCECHVPSSRPFPAEQGCACTLHACDLTFTARGWWQQTFWLLMASTLLWLSAALELVQAYVAKLEARLPAVKHERPDAAPAVDLPLSGVRAVAAIAATAAFLLENVPHLQRFILARCPSDFELDGSGPFAGVITTFEALMSKALKVLDAGLLAALARYVDGPMLPGGGITVMTANLASWRFEHVRSRSACRLTCASVEQMRLLHCLMSRPTCAAGHAAIA